MKWKSKHKYKNKDTLNTDSTTCMYVQHTKPDYAISLYNQLITKCKINKRTKKRLVLESGTGHKCAWCNLVRSIMWRWQKML